MHLNMSTESHLETTLIAQNFLETDAFNNFDRIHNCVKLLKGLFCPPDLETAYRLGRYITNLYLIGNKTGK